MRWLFTGREPRNAPAPPLQNAIKSADEAVVGFIEESVRNQHWTALKAEAAQHKFCISMTTYLAGCIAASQALLLMLPAAGVVATVAALVGFVVLALRSRKARPVAIAASVLPVATMASLALPQQTILVQASVLYATILFLTVAYRLTMPEAKAKQTGIRWNAILRWSPLAILSGAGIGALGYAMLHNELSLGMTLPAVATILAGFAVVEELYFRNFLQRLTRKAVGPMLAVGLTVTANTALTLPFGSILMTAFAALASTAVSCLYYVKPSLMLSIAANVAIKLAFIGSLTAFS